MLGAQDFCGYYDWTFHHIRSKYGDSALHDLWALAVGQDSQRHYIELGRRDGMKGLFEAWRHTGEDEQCDWTFTLDEDRNVLRWDMRKCPSKGFLVENRLHADEDYCDHCIGWERSMLGSLGMELVHHEHNHCGQCWGEIRVKGKPYQSLELDCDIRKDPRWQNGFLDHFVDQEKANQHPLKLTRKWLGPARLTDQRDEQPLQTVPIVTATSYIKSDDTRCVVFIEASPEESLLRTLSSKILALKPAERPLLLFAYLPDDLAVNFAGIGLPRPLPVLPMLIRSLRSRFDLQEAMKLSDQGWIKLIVDAVSNQAGV